MYIQKQNLTKQNKEKIMNILKDKLQSNFLIIQNNDENNDLTNIVKNLQFKYTFKNLNNKQKQQLKEYIEKTFVSNLQQFLKQKNYNLTKSPLTKLQFNEKNELEFNFLNIMEVNNTNTILSPNVLKNFENHLLNKIKFLFDLDLKIKENNNLNTNNNIQQTNNYTYETNLNM